MRGEEERLLYWNREIEASRAAKIRCFLAGYSLMGRKTGQPQPLAAVGAACAGAVCASQLLCLLLLLHLLLLLLHLLQLLLQVGCISSCSASLAFFCFLLWCASCADALAFLLHLTPNPVKQQARRGARKRKAPAASPTFQPRSASSPDFVPSGGQFVERNRGNQEGILKEVRQITGVTDSKSTGGATHSSACRAGNEGGLAAGARKKGAK